MVRKKQNNTSAIEALASAQDLVFAPLTFQALSTLIDLGILEYIDKTPSILEDIMHTLKLEEYVVKTLLEVAEVSKIVKLDDNKYYITKKGQMFLYDEMTIANFNFIKDVCYLGASELTTSFISKQPKGLHKYIGNYETIYPALSLLPIKIKESWYAFDHLYSDNCFDLVLNIIKQKYNTIFDIGGNTGKFERVCLKNGCDITMLDLPANINVVLNNEELKGCKFYPINVLDNDVKYPKFNNCAVLMSQFLDCFSKEQILKILNDLKNSIDNNSTIYILEPFTDNQNYEAAKFSLTHISLYFTCMANGVSKMYTQEEFLNILNNAGLRIKKIHNNLGPFDYTLLECSKE